MSSTIEITKICEHCGATFIARKCSTRFCCKRCAEHAYKQQRRNQHIAEQQHIANSTNTDKISELEFISPAQCALLIGVSRRTLYRYLEGNKIPCCQFNGCTRIRRTDVDSLFGNQSLYVKREKKRAESIEEFYTTKEVLKKFGISNSWLFKMAKERNIPKTVVRGKTLWSRKHIDKALADKQPGNSTEEEWYSVEEVCAKFNMSKEAVYRFVSERRIGKRKEKCRVFYSRRQFDKAMGIDSELEPEYYTMPEAMARYNMTRDQISHYVRTHNIPRTYEGRYVRIDRKALDALFAPPKIS